MKTKETAMKKIVKFLPAFDKRNEDPNKNYGIGGVKCYMFLIGDKGAVHFIFSTGMYLPDTHTKWLSKFDRGGTVPYMGYDVGYHSPTPKYKDQTPNKNCEYLNGKTCYYDGSSMMAEKFMEVLVKEGSDRVWEMLKEYYVSVFEEV
jgi:hypothetical protein